MKTELTLLLALAFLGVATANAAETEPLPSPYFVDEVHCDGLYSTNVTENWLLPAEDVESVKRVIQRGTCDAVMKHYGVEKFMWLSPEDLERVSTTIKQSGHFQESELTIQKSELKNHVHVFLKVKPLANYRFSLSNDLKYYAGRDDSSSRLSNRLQVEATDIRRNPLVNSKFGVIVEGTTADSGLTTPPADLIADDVTRLGTKGVVYNADLYYKMNAAMSQNFSYTFGAHLLADNVNRNKNSRMGVMIDAEVLYHSRVALLKGKTFIGLAYMSGTAHDYDSTSKYYSMPGLTVGYNYGQDFGNNLNFKMSAFQTSDTQYLIDYDLNASYALSFVDLSLIGSYKFRRSQGVRLPQDRFPYLSNQRSESWAGLAKNMVRGDSKQQIALVAGFETLGTGEYKRLVAGELESIDRGASFVGLKYKAALTSGWDLNLGANYYQSRNH